MTGEDNFDDKHKLNSALVEIERLRAELAKCGKENCVGRIIDGYAEWVRAERLEKAEAELATAQATYLQFCKKHDEKIEKAIKALELAEDVLSRAPMSTMIWPNG